MGIERGTDGQRASRALYCRRNERQGDRSDTGREDEMRDGHRGGGAKRWGWRARRVHAVVLDVEKEREMQRVVLHRQVT